MAEPITLREWISVVRRVRLGLATKVVALTLATYADSDGSRVRPGVARLSFECELSYTTVKTALRLLRELGLIEKVGRRGEADVYQLILHPDLMERVNVPTLAEETVHIEQIRVTYRGSRKNRVQTASQTASIDSDEAVQTGTQTAREKVCSRVDGPRSGRADGLTTPVQTGTQTATYQDLNTTKTFHSGEEVCADVTVEGQQADDDPIPPPVPLDQHRCPHGKTNRLNRQGKPRCEDCRAEAESVTPAASVQLKPKCEHGLPLGKCVLCRKGLPGARA